MKGQTFIYDKGLFGPFFSVKLPKEKNNKIKIICIEIAHER